MSHKQKILFLTLYTFSLTGGIEKVSKIIAKVLEDGINSKSLFAQSIKILSLCDLDKDIDTNYCNKQHHKGYGYRKLKFTWASFKNGLQSSTIIISHVNLLLIVYLIKLFAANTNIIMFAHGIEVWRNLKPWQIKFLNKHVQIWAVSEYTAQVLQEKHQISNKKITIVNNCLDPYFTIPTNFKAPQYLIDRHQLKQNQPVIFTLSRLSSTELYKGYDRVISAMPQLLKKFPNLAYILAGKADAKEQERLNQLISAKQLQQNVILAGYIAHDELVDYFLLADTFVMPSKKEGFGIVFIEAAAAGCKVIAGNKDGSTDALLNGELGLLADPDSDEQLVNAIENTLKSGKSEALSLSLQQKSLAHFAYPAYKQKVISLLNQQLSA